MYYSNLNNHKPSGPDEIPTTLLKKLATVIPSVLTMIFQASLHQCLTLWIGNRLYSQYLIRKEKDVIQAISYRPVSLTCICQACNQTLLKGGSKPGMHCKNSGVGTTPK